MSKKEYVYLDEYDGSFVGTLPEILEWQLENNIPLLRGSFFELGNKVETGSLFKEE